MSDDLKSSAGFCLACTVLGHLLTTVLSFPSETYTFKTTCIEKDFYCIHPILQINRSTRQSQRLRSAAPERLNYQEIVLIL